MKEPRAGSRLAIARIVLVLADGTREVWEFPEGDTAYYRVGKNSMGPKKDLLYKKWMSHEIHWQSEIKVEGGE